MCSGWVAATALKAAAVMAMRIMAGMIASVENQLAGFGVDGEPTGLIQDRKAKQRSRLFRRDARDHVMHDPIPDANGVDADEVFGAR